VRIFVAVLCSASVLVGCGGSSHAALAGHVSKAAPAHKPAPSSADIAQLSQIQTQTPYQCSFANIGSATPQGLQDTVTQLEAMLKRDDPGASIVLVPGTSPTTLRQVIGNVIRTLDGNGSPTCDPGLGAQLSQATGIPSS
jgi:hypothetical protein